MAAPVGLRRSLQKSSTNPLSAAAGQESVVLIQGVFTELDQQLQFVRHVKILVTNTDLIVTAFHNILDLSKATSEEDCVKMELTSVDINFLDGVPYTLEIKAYNQQDKTRIFQMCGDESTWSSWLKFLSIDNEEDQDESETTNTMLPAGVAFYSETVSISSSSADEDSDYSDDDRSDSGLTRCLALGVGLSAYNNRWLSGNLGLARGTSSLSIDSEIYLYDEYELQRSCSYPSLSPLFSLHTASLPNLRNLEQVQLDQDLDFKYRERPTYSSKHENENKNIDADNLGQKYAKTEKEIALTLEVEEMKSHPADLHFQSKGVGLVKTLAIINSMKRKRTFSIKRKFSQKNERKFSDISGERSSESLTLESIDPTQKMNKISVMQQLLGKFKRKSPNCEQLENSSASSNDSIEQDVNSDKVSTTTPGTPQVKTQNNIRGSSRFASFRKKQKSISLESPRLSSPTESLDAGEVFVDRPVSPQKSPELEGRKSPRQSGEIFRRKRSESQTSSSSTGSLKKKLVQKILSPLKRTSDTNIAVNVDSEDLSPEKMVSTNSSTPVAWKSLQRLANIDIDLFVQELTLIDKELFIRITWKELATCGWMKKDKHNRSPNVMSMVEFFNRIAMLIGTEILAEDSPPARAKVISKVIRAAARLRSLGNFNSLKALLGGLQCTPIYRLKESWNEVSKKKKKTFRQLSQIMGETDNFAVYRTELASLLNSSLPCLPFLGDFLTQIAQTQTYLGCAKKKAEKHHIKNLHQSPGSIPKISLNDTRQRSESHDSCGSTGTYRDRTESHGSNVSDCTVITNDFGADMKEIETKLDQLEGFDKLNIAKGTELQLWKYQIAAIQFYYESKASIRQYLLNSSFNTEEMNYKLSLQREPPTK